MSDTAVAVVAPTVDAATVARFESLGHNCEFAFVQLRGGYDKGSLLRWAYVHTTEQLIDALAREFAGLFASRDSLRPLFGSTMVEDAAFGIGFHCEMKATAAPGGWAFIQADEEFSESFRREREKLAYLTRVTLASLRAAERIWVYKHTDGVPAMDAMRLHQALRRFGPNRLLVVVEASAAHPPGEVTMLADGLYCGAVERYSPLSEVDRVDHAAWMRVLRRTLALRRHGG